MEIILGIAIIALVAYVFTRKKDVVEANAEEVPYKVEAPTVVALGEPPATVVVVEGAGAVEVPAEVPAEKPAKKPRAKKAAAPKAEKKPRAKKAK